MAAAENGERIDDLNLIVSKVAEISSLFDQDGIVSTRKREFMLEI